MKKVKLKIGLLKIYDNKNFLIELNWFGVLLNVILVVFLLFIVIFIFNSIDGNSNVISMLFLVSIPITIGFSIFIFNSLIKIIYVNKN